MIKASNVGSEVASVYSGKVKKRDRLDDLAEYVQHYTKT
jgi:hypothetical protein